MVSTHPQDPLADRPLVAVVNTSEEISECHATLTTGSCL